MLHGCSWKLATSELINMNPQSKKQESDDLYKLLEPEEIYLSYCFSLNDL